MATAAPGVSLLPEVESFLNSGPLAGVVGGKDTAGTSGETIPTRDPGTGEVLAEVHAFTAADVDAGVAVANEAFRKSGWATMSPNPGEKPACARTAGSSRLRQAPASRRG